MQNYVLALSLDFVHQTAMVSLYPCLLSSGSMLATLEAAQDAQGAGLFWFIQAVKNYKI